MTSGRDSTNGGLRGLPSHRLKLAEDTCPLAHQCRLPLSTRTVNHLADLLRRHLKAIRSGAEAHCWTIAEWAGESTPDGMRHLLGRARRDAGEVRDDVRAHVMEHLRDDQAVRRDPAPERPHTAHLQRDPTALLLEY